MNRLEFLKEMKNSLFKTVQSACAPLVDEKIEKLDRSIDVISQMQWWHVTNEVNATKAIETKYIDGQSILVVHEHKTIRAFSGACPSCSYLLHVFQTDFACKCMNCDEDFSLTSTEKASLQEYPLKKREDGYYVGLTKRSSF
ncbi:MAG: hypothetical protein ACI33M_07700 [Lysinibacillus sp.]